MDTFITNDDIVYNELIGYKCILCWGYNMGNDWLHPISNCFGYNSVENIAKIDRPKICDFFFSLLTLGIKAM